MTHTITALFDTAEAAEKAARDLADRVGGVRGTIYDSRTSGDVETLSSIPGEDRATLQENIRRGGAVFYAQVPDEKFDAVSDVLEENGASNFDEREAGWRREGWAARSGAASTGVTGTTTAEATQRRDIGTTGSEERIPLVEENIVVGKRDVGRTATKQ